MRRAVGLMMAGLALLGLYALTGSARRGGGKRRPSRLPHLPPRPEPAVSGGKWDEVDETSYQSFPASDPPPYCRAERRSP